MRLALSSTWVQKVIMKYYIYLIVYTCSFFPWPTGLSVYLSVTIRKINCFMLQRCFTPGFEPESHVGRSWLVPDDLPVFYLDYGTEKPDSGINECGGGGIVKRQYEVNLMDHHIRTICQQLFTELTHCQTKRTPLRMSTMHLSNDKFNRIKSPSTHILKHFLW